MAKVVRTSEELTGLVPDFARAVLTALEDAGYEAWIVGGWVRDALLGNPAHDVDVCSSAPWQEAAHVLKAAGMAVFETGTAHGTITCVIDHHPVEVTTFRVEHGYSDLRHPDEVIFVDDVRQDLARRDFTVNAMAYHPERGLLDPFGGSDDLSYGILCAVGEPEERLAEDALRVLRAVRFAARFNLTIEPETAAVVKAYAPNLATIARERVGQELTGILATGRMGWALRTHPEVMCAALPCLAPSLGFSQRSPYHAYDVYEHTSRVCDGVEAFTGGLASEELRWAALFHDVAKPETFSTDESGRGHFFGHPKLGARVAESVLSEMAVPRRTVKRAVTLISLHDRQLNPTERAARRILCAVAERVPDSPAALTYDLISLKRADAIAKDPKHRNDCTELDEVERLVSQQLRQSTAMRVRDLAVTGADVMHERAIEAGPEVGIILDWLLTSVVDDGIPNTREALLELLRM